MDVAKLLSVVRILSYSILVVSLAYVAICEYNSNRMRRAGLFGLTSCYYGLALLSLVVEYFDPAGATLVRMLLTPILVLQTAIALWVWWRPSPGQSFRPVIGVAANNGQPISSRGIGFRQETWK